MEFKWQRITQISYIPAQQHRLSRAHTTPGSSPATTAIFHLSSDCDERDLTLLQPGAH